MSTWQDCWIGFLELPARARYAFERARIEKIGALDAMTFRNLRDIPGIGPKTAHEVFEAMDRLRHRFRRSELEPMSKEEFRLRLDRVNWQVSDRLDPSNKSA